MVMDGFLLDLAHTDPFPKHVPRVYHRLGAQRNAEIRSTYALAGHGLAARVWRCGCATAFGRMRKYRKTTSYNKSLDQPIIEIPEKKSQSSRLR
eukprot:s3776_g4.t1